MLENDATIYIFFNLLFKIYFFKWIANWNFAFIRNDCMKQEVRKEPLSRECAVKHGLLQAAPWLSKQQIGQRQSKDSKLLSEANTMRGMHKH